MDVSGDRTPITRTPFLSGPPSPAKQTFKSSVQTFPRKRKKPTNCSRTSPKLSTQLMQVDYRFSILDNETDFCAGSQGLLVSYTGGHNLCVFCLGEEHTRTVLEGAVCVNCERLPLKTLRSHLALFSSGEVSPPVPAEAADEDALLDDDDILSLTSSDPGPNALLAASPREQEMAEEEEVDESAAPLRPPCLLALVSRALLVYDHELAHIS
ncbi:hypothetical protein DPX16_9492 [Anabarilius grahami]|uniref:Uncharacterized protein n=1 Tax=Anabarilius grahami TaxID=495550 RepID=A0A3N0Z681_ANAGA|nr:hypothetical protein DPX16_9492 [Anabarilius grahami]